jgi:chemotaxis protein MotA
LDLASLIGLVLAFGGILGGMLVEGGHLGALVQPTAFMIVWGGTFGASFVQTPMEDIKLAFSLAKLAFLSGDHDDPDKIIAELISAAQIARKESILALEKKLNNFSHPYMQTIFRFVIDGVDPNTIKDIFESEIYLEQEHFAAGIKFWEAAGGFAPTIGIIGAVLGLIHVMENLTDTAKLGEGIAVAFVATIYGLVTANVFCIPMGNKIKRKMANRAHAKDMILTGALGIVNGMNPFIIEEKLRSYSHGPKKAEGQGGK